MGGRTKGVIRTSGLGSSAPSRRRLRSSRGTSRRLDPSMLSRSTATKAIGRSGSSRRPDSGWRDLRVPTTIWVIIRPALGASMPVTSIASADCVGSTVRKPSRISESARAAAETASATAANSSVQSTPSSSAKRVRPSSTRAMTRTPPQLGSTSGSGTARLPRPNRIGRHSSGRLGEAGGTGREARRRKGMDRFYARSPG